MTDKLIFLQTFSNPLKSRLNESTKHNFFIINPH